MSRVEPLLFLDVDGPLLPFGGEGVRLDLDRGLGARLAGLGCQLVWATTWGEDANTELAPLLGLSPLPVVEWPEDEAVEAFDLRARRHWKTRGLVAWAAGRPFVWVDDEIGAADREWVAEQHPGAALLVRVDPGVGLTEGELQQVAAWVRQLGC